MAEEQIGLVTHYFSKIGVAVFKIEKGSLKVGDTIHIKGRTTDFQQKVTSMQVEHENIEEAKPGDDIGMKVDEQVRGNDKVFKVAEE